MKTKIEYVKKKLKYGFIGMNKNAAKVHHIPYKHKQPEHTIIVYKKVSKPVRVATIRHEEMERYLMKKHLSYKKAHYNALRFENLNKPFPKTNIKQKLKKMGFKVIK